MAFMTAVSGLPQGRGIMPDQAMVPSIRDTPDGKDVGKELAIRFIGGKTSLPSN
jgi:hypothetical protein